MLKQFSVAIFLSSLLFSMNTLAAESNLSKESKAKLAEKLAASIGLEVDSIKASPLPALVEVITNQGVFYASTDGEFLVHGKLYGLGGPAIVNHTEESLSSVRAEGIKKFKDSMIVYPAKNEKHVITVFTDITCGYCRKLHKEMNQLNDMGITVQYLAYPRAGIKDQLGQNSQGFNDLRSIWCHEKPDVALTKAKLGSSVAQRICDRPIEEQFEFGRQVGVGGTPAIIFENGFMLPGYKAPADLLKIIESVKAES